MDESLDESYRFCGRLARREARNFYWGFLLLPPERRRSMCALYAFLRHTDDLADEGRPIADRRANLRAWRVSLEQSLDSAPQSWPGLPALVDTVRRYTVPVRYLHEVIDGCEMDLEARTFSTFGDLY